MYDQHMVNTQDEYSRWSSIEKKNRCLFIGAGW